MSARRASFVAAPLALCLLAFPARSETNDTFRFAWVRGTGAERCPSERELAERVKARLGRDPFDDAAVRVIEGSVMHESGHFRLELRVRDESGALLGERTLGSNGDDCASLADAATLAVVLTIDPDASLDEAATRALAEPPPPRAPLAAPPARPCPPLPKLALPPPCPSCSEPAVRASLAAHALAAAGSLPSVVPGAQISGEIAWKSARFGAGAFFLPAVTNDAGHITIGLTSAVLAACLAIGSAFDLCAQFDAGVVRVSAEELAPVNPGEYPWLAAGLGPRAGFDVTENLRLELAAFAVAPLARHEFVVRGRDETFQASPIGGRLLLGARLK